MQSFTVRLRSEGDEESKLSEERKMNILLLQKYSDRVANILLLALRHRWWTKSRDRWRRQQSRFSVLKGRGKQERAMYNANKLPLQFRLLKGAPWPSKTFLKCRQMKKSKSKTMQLCEFNAAKDAQWQDKVSHSIKLSGGKQTKLLL